MKQLVQNIRTGLSEVQDVPAPIVRDGEVLIRVRASLVSAGTERMVVDFARKSLLAKARARPDLVRQTLTKFRREGFASSMNAVRSRLDQPMALGYSVAGEVIGAGAGVSGFAAGDRVAAAGAGRAVHAEIVSVPRNLVVPCAVSVSFESAAFTTLGAIALHGIRLTDAKLGETVAVIGLGLLGQLAVQLLRAAGCAVIALDPAADRAAIAARGGAAAHVDPSAFEADVLARTGGHGADAVVITAATESSEPVALAGRVARDKGIVVAVGAVGLELPRKPYFEKEIAFRISRSYGPGRYDTSYEEQGIDYPYGYVRWTENRNMAAFAELLATGAVDPSPFITHRIGIDEGSRAYALLSGQTDERFLGIVLSFPDRAEAAKAIVRLDAERPRASSEQVRLGVIGAGNFARAVLLPAFRAAGAEFAGVAAGSGASARHAADAFRFRYCTTDAAAILNDPDVDAVVIATRHRLHAAQTIDALRAGKHVFVEKPLCLISDELDEIIRVYQSLARRPVVGVGFNRRFAPLSQRMKETFRGVNEPMVVTYRVNGGFIPPSSWIQDRGEGGRLVGEAVHFIDWACWMTGEAPARVSTVAAANAGKYSDDNLLITIEFQRGSVFSLAYLASGHFAMGKERIEVHGGGRSAVIDDFRRFEAWSPAGHQKQRLFNADKGHRAECAAFTGAVRGGALPMTFEEIVTTMRTTFAAAESLKTRLPVDVP